MSHHQSAPQAEPENLPFWEGAQAGELRVQRCQTCGHHQLYARLWCVSCGGRALTWTAVRPRGTVYSFTVVRRAPTAEFAADVPYPIALVDLDAGPRLMGHVVGCPVDEVTVGMPVGVRFAPRQGLLVAQFTPIGS
ncbi:MAG: nucleic acid-binding protein [Micromonosporaceae bacterium]|nr:nucleic acid-binding protein [Micromonosporaceae bacterium]